MMDHGKSKRNIQLTRNEIDAIILYVNLNNNVKSLTLTQDSKSGIGITTMAHYDTGEKIVTQDITDVSSW